MRRRSSRYRDSLGSSYRCYRYSRGSSYRRRRGPRRSLIVALLVLVVLAVAAVVTAARDGAGGTSTTAPRSGGGETSAARPARHRHGHHAGSSAARAQRRDSRGISTALRYTPFVAAGASRRRVIALTFDDGPGPYTQSIVRILVRMHVRATFFIVGQELRYFSAGLRDEVAHGFEIGDHTENHAWLAHLNAAGQYAQIQDAAVGIERVGAPAPRLFRPPYGIYNATTLATLHHLKMFMVMWSIDPGDWRRPGTKAIVQNVLANSEPGRIVIMHDGGGDRSQTVAALPAIVRGLRRRGYRLVTVPQLVTLDPPPRRQNLPQLGTA